MGVPCCRGFLFFFKGRGGAAMEFLFYFKTQRNSLGIAVDHLQPVVLLRHKLVLLSLLQL